MPTRSVIAAILFIRPSHAGPFSASTPLYPPEQPRLVDPRPLRRPFVVFDLMVSTEAAADVATPSDKVRIAQHVGS